MTRPVAASFWICLLLLATSACSFLTPATDADQSALPEGVGDDIERPAADPSEVTTTTAALADPLWQQLQLELTFVAQMDEPIAAVARSGSLNYYVAERAGRVRVIEREISDRGRESIRVVRQPLLDLTDEVSTDSEQGLLGILFSSDGRQLCVSYTNLGGTLVITEFTVSRTDRVDLESRRELLRVPQPAGNHNGGSLALGPDGFLYIGLGDGGGSGDPEGNSQDTQTLLGSVVRIDRFATGDKPYGIPDGNPFAAGGDGLPEIWLWGVRNPWRLSFDSETGDLWIGDVGQDDVEEIDLLTRAGGGGRGANLGWNEMEGDRPFNGGAPPAGHVPPLFTYLHENGRCSVTGGYVYRGDALPLLDGVYVFGDYCSGEIFGLQALPEGVVMRPLTVASDPNLLGSFGQGPDGEILVLERSGPDDLGAVYRIDPKKGVTEDE